MCSVDKNITNMKRRHIHGRQKWAKDHPNLKFYILLLTFQ